MAGREYENREAVQNRNVEKSSSGQFLVGALIGGVAGAIAALLLAPKSGKELRDKFVNKTKQISETVWEKGNEIASIKKVKNVSLSESLNNWEERESSFISLNEPIVKEKKDKKREEDIRKKLEEAKRAFEEEEKKVIQ